MPNISNQDKSQSDMRHRENRGESGKEHLTKDGQPDHRFKENREDQGNNNPKIDKQNDSDGKFEYNLKNISFNLSIFFYS